MQQAWFLAYGLLGLAQNGLAPILLPLAEHGPEAGISYAAFALSGLLAPAVGGWADHAGRHRDLLIWGTAGAAVCFALMAIANGPARIALAAAAGCGTMAATTAGNVLAIQGQPDEDWDDRVAALQRFISAGQVIGLVAAGVLAGTHLRWGFVCGGLVLAVGSALALLTAPGRAARAPHDKPAIRPLVGGEAGVPGPQHHAHHVTWQQLAAFLTVITPALRRFLIIWLVAYPAMNGIALMFPVVMTREFGMAPLMPSAAYAIGVAASLPLYGRIGRAMHHRSGGAVLKTGFAARLVLFAALTALGLLHGSAAGWLVLICFALTQIIWPLLAVGANSLAVRLAPAARGESVGLFNATTAIASSVGSALAGVIFSVGGLAALAGLACLSVAAALALSAAWLPTGPVQKSRSV